MQNIWLCRNLLMNAWMTPQSSSCRSNVFGVPRAPWGGVGRRNGFTLIELLVVISIVGILFAILFPLTGTVLRKAKETKCGAELKGLLAWTIAYSLDNDDVLPDLRKHPRSGADIGGVALRPSRRARRMGPWRGHCPPPNVGRGGNLLVGDPLCGPGNGFLFVRYLRRL